MANSNPNEITWKNSGSEIIQERLDKNPLEEIVLTAPLLEALRADYNSNLYQIAFLVNILEKFERDEPLSMFAERITFA